MTEGGKRVLIVDDEPNLRLTLADILRDEGYVVESVGDGESAVRKVQEQDYDVVLLDVRMAGIDGVEAFRRIRRHREGLRVIMMSAYSVEDIRQNALEDGAAAFLPKPLNLEQVLDLIEEVHDTAILVVEDDTETASSIATALRDKGYWVRVTGSPHDALELVEQIRFDIILMDVQLPSMNGLELYLAIRQITPSAVAIMISEMEAESESMAREAVARTAYTFLRKPLDLNKLLGLLERVDGQRHSDAIRKPDPDSL